jgi:hypothetical protein
MIVPVAMLPHLTSMEILLVIVLYAAWLIPAWLLKLLAVAEAIRRYRRLSDHDKKGR